jgi:hypothetical protein
MLALLDIKLRRGGKVYKLGVWVRKVGIQVHPVTKGGRNVLTLYDRHIAGWILHFVQDDMTVARPYLMYQCVNLMEQYT